MAILDESNITWLHRLQCAENVFFTSIIGTLIRYDGTQIQVVIWNENVNENRCVQ